MKKVDSIGIWGFGVVGKSALTFLANFYQSIRIYDHRPLSDEEQALIISYNAHAYRPNQLEQFLTDNQYILPSPGIILPATNNIFLNELDIFFAHARIPIIAVTGSVGKTTVVTVLDQILRQAGKKILTGGNIGTPLFDLLKPQEMHDLFLLELSSFQLEHSTQCAPDIAVWTNFHPNHLDRHKTQEEYFKAKQCITIHQTSDQVFIAPQNILEKVNTHAHKIIPKDIGGPKGIHKDNWALITAIFNQLDISVDIDTVQLSALPHRVEYVRTINGVSYYNDSKATVPAATLGALAQLRDNSVHLILGGLSKGVDRSNFIAQLPAYVEHIYCFGTEADHLDALCKKYNKNSIVCSSLEEVIISCKQNATPGHVVLFSPAGSSFDLFTNYIERGNSFKRLVNQLDV